MEKFVVGQKVVRATEDQEPEFFNAKCRAAGVDPKSALTVTSVSHSGEWLGLDGLTVEGEIHLWKRNNFEPFIEPAEASPAVVFACAEIQKAEADGWIECHGGKCPVGGDVLVDYRMRGKYLGEGVKGCKLRWEHKDWSSDIVAYRPHVKEKTEEQKLRDRLDILESGYNEEINKRINAEREASAKIAKLESQLNDELHSRMSREQLIAHLRVILGENGRELKDRRSQVEMMLGLLGAADNRVKELDQVIANHSKLMQAQGVVIEQSRDNVSVALALAASTESNVDVSDCLARLVKSDQQRQDEKIGKMMNDRYVVNLPF